MDNKLLRQIVGVVIVVGLIGGGVWLARRNKEGEEEVASEIVLESSKMMEPDEGLEMPMTEEEREVIEEAFMKEGAEMTALKDVVGGQGAGTGWRHFDGEKFYHKVEAKGLTPLEKGFFYEGWLVGDAGFFSTGRMAMIEGEGKLYYQADEDKTDFRGVVITLEPEDGDPAPAGHILEGSF